MHLLTSMFLGEMLLGAGALRRRRRGPLPFELVHVLPGRVRFRVAGVRDDAARGELLSERLRAVPGVTTVVADPRSGSVLVRFVESKETRETIIAALRGATATPPPEPEAPDRALRGGAGGPMLRQRLVAFGRHVDQHVTDATHGLTDTRTLVAVLAGGWAIKTLVAPGSSSRWSAMTLSWWSYNLLRR